jgi:hypothetical protein
MTPEPSGVSSMVQVSVRVESLAVEDDVWCDTCNLSTASRFWFTTTTNGQTTLRSRTVCSEHDDRRCDS